MSVLTVVMRAKKQKKIAWHGSQPRPIESRLRPVMAFDCLLPPAIGEYVLDVADRQQAPPDFAAVAALVGLASIIGNRARMKPKQFDDWEREPLGAAIGAPSMMKTSSDQIGAWPGIRVAGSAQENMGGRTAGCGGRGRAG